ncbi:MAG: adenylosuccinate lyase [Candidatus Gottesmanbacteria bacterium]
MAEREAELSKLTAISPIDGRYRDKVEDLAPYTSEAALIKTRVEIEARYLICLSDIEVIRPLSSQERELLINFGPRMTIAQVQRVKDIETVTRHDVKAMERAFREFVAGTTMHDVIEMIHFGLTSEDVNNLSVRRRLYLATKEVCIPALDQLVDSLVDRAKQYKGIPMLGRTHGQPAIPTTLGKEIANMAIRLNRQVRKLEAVRLTGKLNGAIGNYNAHVLAAPEVDWISFSQKFVRSLGLEPYLFTTQINPYEDMIELFQAFQRVNGVILDIDQDMWRYISDDWFIQDVKKGEVGSSTMPQKVNPIDFENSEANVQIANSLWEGMSRKLAVSRLQRDLSDSSTGRNYGVALAHGLLANRNTLAGLNRIRPNTQVIEQKLNENWVILTEGVQTVLRWMGVKDPYSMVAGLSRGQRIGQTEWQSWVNHLEIPNDVKTELWKLTPETYIGHAEKLTDMAIEEINLSRKKI